MDLRSAILDAALARVPFEGWTDSMLRGAVKDAGLPDGADALYVSGGPLELIRMWNQRTVDHVEAEIARRGLANQRIRDRVRESILIALTAIGPHEGAMRRALSRLAMPDAVGEAPKQSWALADAIWHGIGDTSTDFNYYSKRTILSGILGTSTLAWLNDTSSDKAEARAFVERRIDNVMQFEKAKARARDLRDRVPGIIPNPTEIIGRLRYGAPGFPRASTKRRRRRAR